LTRASTHQSGPRCPAHAFEHIAANYKRVAGFQVDAINAKPPIVQVRAS
jgi:hypothetical protein